MGSYKPKEGFVWNPLKPYRNLPCPCQSGKKVKRCCGRFDALDAKTADAVNKYLEHLRDYGFIDAPKAERT